MSLLPFKFKDEVKLDFLSIITNALLVKALFVYICIDLYRFVPVYTGASSNSYIIY